jgi:NNP family nitrate/nitrite transporter-like MFS transporter
MTFQIPQERATKSSGTFLADGKATRIALFSFKAPHMRTFHMAWLAFFLAFFGWFGVAPLMAVIRDDLNLTKAQVGNTVIASVAATIVARLVIGWAADRFGPRLTYSLLLVVGAVPVMLVGLANSYESFLLFRLAIGVIGASFVLTQYHTSTMFAPNVVGTANATTAGWGNLGGGVTQMVMPLALAALVALGATEVVGWRLAMVFPGVALVLVGVAYFFFTQDTPAGNFRDTRPAGGQSTSRGSFISAARDHRVWALFVVYGACFGIELTINNVAALYYHDRFGLSVGVAGLIAGLFGLMNLFARSLGGIFGDRFGIRYGLRGRVWFLGGVLLLEGLALVLFSGMAVLALAIPAMIVFSIFVQMSEGATYSVVPFINRNALGAVSGIVGAGGNAGAVMAGFLFRIEGLETQTAFLFLGLIVVAVSSCVAFVRFSPRDEVLQRQAIRAAVATGESAPAQRGAPAPVFGD